MKKLIKILVIAGGVVIVLLGVASVALHVLLPPEKAKALVLKQLTVHLKREVTLGKVSVGVLTGLNVSDLKVSEAPNFSRGTFISSDHFSIRLALLPLIFRKVEVKELVLDHPVIRIVRLADGKTFNFSDLLSPPSKTPSPLVGEGPGWGVAYAESLPPPPFPSPTKGEGKSVEPSFQLTVSQAQIQGGVVHFLDQSPARQSVDIDPLDLKLKNVSLTSPFTVQAYLKAKARNVVAALKLAGEADLGTGSFKFKNCDLSSGGSTVSLVGKASQLKSNRPSVDLNLDVKELKLSTFAPFIALPPELKLEGPILGAARLKGNQDKMDVTAEVNLDKVRVAYAQQFSKPSNVPMSVSLRGTLTGLQDLEIGELKTVLGSLQLTGHGKVLAVASAQPQMNLHVQSNTFQVNELMTYAATALPPGLSVKGRAQFAADVSGTQTSSQFAAKCDGNDLEIALADQFQKPAGVPLRASVVGEKVAQTVTLQSLSAALGSIELKGKGSIQTGAAIPKFQLSLKSNAIALADLAQLSPLAASYKPSGTAALDVRASGTADAPQANGSLNLQNVSLHYQQSDLTQITAPVTFTQQDVLIPKLTGKLNGSDITLKLAGHRLQTQPDINVEANITELDLAKLLPPVPSASVGGLLDVFVAEAWAAVPPAAAPPAKLSGHLTVGHIKHEFYDAKNLDFKWNLTDVTPDLSQVNGMSTLKQGPGLLKDVEKLAAMSKSARIALLPIATLQKMDKNGFLKSLGLPSLQTISFSGIHGDYAFRSGVMDIKAFEVTGDDLNLNTTGTIGLAGVQPLDLRVTMKLAPGSIRGTLGQVITDESGRPTLAFAAKGTASNPNVHLDMREAGQKAIKQLGQELFKGFGIGQQAPPPSNAAPDSQQPQQGQPQQAAPSPQSNPAEDLQKAFKNIFH